MRPGFVALAAVGFVTILALSFSTFWSVFSRPAERVAPNVQLADVEIGGVPQDEVSDLVAARLKRYADSTVYLPSPLGRIGYRATDLGYRPELEATLAKIQALGVPLKREEVLADWAGDATPKALQPAFSLDETKLDEVVDTLARSIDRPPVDASLKVNPDTSIELVPAKPGQRVDRDELLRRMKGAFRTLGTEVQVPIESVPPAVGDTDVRKAKEAAEQFVSAPIDVRFGDRAWTLSRGDLASWVVFTKGGPDKLGFDLHPERPRNWLTDRASDVTRPARDTRIKLVNGKPTVASPEEPGREVDLSGAIAAIRASGLSNDRKVDVPTKAVPPRVGAADLAKLSFSDLLAEAATSYAGGIPERNHNVELAATRVDGVVVPAGASFSFNNAIGRTRIKDGYQVAYGISATDDGVQTIPSVAGGICQVSTTLFHAVFWTGLPIEERHEHAYWIPRYGVPPKGMPGLDTTVDEDAGLDFRFKNTSGAPLLVQASTDGSRLIFRLYGTKTGWDVSAGQPQLTNFVKADDRFVRQEDPTLASGRSIQIEEARDGFDALVTRVVKGKDGQVIDRLELRSHYAPSRNLVVVGTKRA